jgi:hypothetical protein
VCDFGGGGDGDYGVFVCVCMHVFRPLGLFRGRVIVIPIAVGGVFIN